MGDLTLQSAALWRLARRQYWVLSHDQLLGAGVSAKGIKHRVADGRIHRVHRGVYVVGRRDLSDPGRWMAAVLACGPTAYLSHGSTAAHWGILRQAPSKTTVSVPLQRCPTHPGIHVHRRAIPPPHLTRHRGIPVTSPACTLVDLACELGPRRLEAAVNEAANLDLIDPESLRAALEDFGGRRGVAILRALLDRHTFRLTDSGLERRFLRLVATAGLPVPETRRYLASFRTDFYWPDLRLVVEADSLRYHRTPAQQARDRLRDQAHLARGITPLRFTDRQIHDHPEYVAATLRSVANRLNQAPTEGLPGRTRR